MSRPNGRVTTPAPGLWAHRWGDASATIVTITTMVARGARWRSTPGRTGMTPLNTNQLVDTRRHGCANRSETGEGLGGRGAEGTDAKRRTVRDGQWARRHAANEPAVLPSQQGARRAQRLCVGKCLSLDVDRIDGRRRGMIVVIEGRAGVPGRLANEMAVDDRRAVRRPMHVPGWRCPKGRHRQDGDGRGHEPEGTGADQEPQLSGGLEALSSRPRISPVSTRSRQPGADGNRRHAVPVEPTAPAPEEH